MRWTILAFLAGFSVVSYVLRVNISVAAKFMMSEFQLSEIQMGQIFSSFMVGYAIFQVPGGILGDRWGPRRALTAAALCWGLTTILTAWMPGNLVRSAGLIFLTLAFLRFFLGAGEAATYPVAARAVANWTPPSQRALGNALVLAGMPLGSAITAPLVSWLMVTVGWRGSFYLTSTLAFFIALMWWLYATDFPHQHRRLRRAGLALLQSDATSGDETVAPSAPPWFRLLRERNIALLAISYFFEGYVLFMFVFWLYIYLIDVRGFTILSGGLFASLPWLVALVLTPAGGALTDSLATRLGRLGGSRIVVMSVYLLSAACLMLGATAQSRYLAVAAISFSVGFLMAAEAAFWSSAIHLAGAHAGAACGIMNMAGIVGGIISTALVPILVKHYGWLFALGVGSVAAIACAIVWLGIRTHGESSGTRRILQDGGGS